MLKKRIIGVVTVKDGWAVQSFGYCRYLPLGKPEVLVHNLDRWGADEILVQCIDRSTVSLGPDFDLLGKISKLGIATPLIYAGGIIHPRDAVKVISHGADRVMVDTMLLEYPQSVEAVARELGTQAVIAHLPLRMCSDGLKALNYRDRSERPLADWLERLPQNWISEVMITDWSNEGVPRGFDERLINVSNQLKKPLLCFGGVSEVDQIQRMLDCPQVAATGIGNFLSYREHQLQLLKQQLFCSAVRVPHYESTL